MPGEKSRAFSIPNCDSAAVIQSSDLDYTILRPAWFTHADEIDYKITQKREPFQHPDLEVRRSLGVSKPE